MLTILVVDDEQYMLNAINRALKGKYNVVTAKCVVEAIGILKSKDVDIVITDIKMPFESGVELIKYVQEKSSKIGILVITGQSDIDIYLEILSLGVFEYLHKPFENSVLLTILKKMVDRLSI